MGPPTPAAGDSARNPASSSATNTRGGEATRARARRRAEIINIELKAIFANKDQALWPGQSVNAHLIVETVKNGVVVPPGSVQMGPSGSFVYVIKPDSTAEARPVTVGQVEANTALITKGLAAGERIVVSGQAGLSPGVQVAVKQGAPGQMNAQEPEIGPEGVGSTGITTAPAGAGGINPR